MTNLEVLQSRLTFQSLPEVLIQESLLIRALTGSDEYSADNLKAFELTTADLYVEILTSPDFKEGDLSITFDRAFLKSQVIAIYTKYDDPKLSNFNSNESIQAVNLW